MSTSSNGLGDGTPALSFAEFFQDTAQALANDVAKVAKGVGVPADVAGGLGDAARALAQGKGLQGAEQVLAKDAAKAVNSRLQAMGAPTNVAAGVSDAALTLAKGQGLASAAHTLSKDAGVQGGQSHFKEALDLAESPM